MRTELGCIYSNLLGPRKERKAYKRACSSKSYAAQRRTPWYGIHAKHKSRGITLRLEHTVMQSIWTLPQPTAAFYSGRGKRLSRHDNRSPGPANTRQHISGVFLLSR